MSPSQSFNDAARAYIAHLIRHGRVGAALPPLGLLRPACSSTVLGASQRS
jgi:hypothetical protein